MLYTFQVLLACFQSFLGFLACHFIFSSPSKKQKLPVKMTGMTGPSSGPDSRLFETIINWFFDKNVTFYFTKCRKPNAYNQIRWIIKVSTHSKTLSHFCYKFIHLKPFKAVYWWFWHIKISYKMRALFIIFQIIDHAWIWIMLFNLWWKW